MFALCIFLYLKQQSTYAMHTYSLHMSLYYPKSSSFKRDTRESGTIVSILMVRCFRILWKHIVVPDMNWGQAYILITLLGVPVPFQFQLILFWSGFIYLLFEGRLLRHRSLQWTCAVLVFLGRQFFKSASSESLDQKFAPKEGPRFRILWHP